MCNYPEINTLKVGDEVAVLNGNCVSDFHFSRVVKVTATHIKTDFSGLLFDRTTGKGVNHRYRQLVAAEKAREEIARMNRTEKLIVLINQYSLSQEQFEQCEAAFKQVLNN
jgi:hypothetical protein